MKVGILQVQRHHPHAWSEVLKYRSQHLHPVFFHEEAGNQPLEDEDLAKPSHPLGCK